MEKEKIQEIKDIKKRIDLQFGIGGHEDEYILTMPYSRDDLPFQYFEEEKIQLKLGEDWDVNNRGTRIEIRHKNGLQNDELVKDALRVGLEESYWIEE